MITLSDLDIKDQNTIITISNFIIHEIFSLYPGIRFYSIYNYEKTPSMYIYTDKTCNCLKFKDFSSGNQGNGQKLLLDYITLKPKQLKPKEEYKDFIENLSKKRISINLINKSVLKEYPLKLNEYFNKHKDYKKIVIQKEVSIERCEYQISSYNKYILEYFNKYKVCEKDLEECNVFAISNVIIKEERLDDKTKKGIIGYFNDRGSLIQVYIPKELSTDKQKYFRNLSKGKMFNVYCNNIIKDKDITDINVYITGAIKDAVCLYSFLKRNKYKNTIVVSTLSEFNFNTNEIEKNIKEKLKEKLIECFNMNFVYYLLYDMDEHGYNISLQVSKENKNIIPLNIHIMNQIDVKNNKDISDIIKNHNDTTIKQILQWSY